MLTETQKSRARFHGAQEQANRRRHLRQLRTSLFKVSVDAALGAEDNKTMSQTLRILDRMLVGLEADLTHAKNIKRDWDRHVALARALLTAVPLPHVADVIAAGELAREIGHPRMLVDDIERNGWAHVGQTIKRNALDTLANRCAYQATDPTKFVASVRAALPAAAERHADLIRQINTLAVAETLQQMAQPAGGM